MSVELIFIHVTKCGGVALSETLKYIYGATATTSPWTWLGLTPESTNGRKAMWHDYAELRRLWHQTIPREAAKHPEYKVLQGHMPLRLFDGLFPKARRIAFVRHPVRRVWSNYHHDHNHKYIPDAMTVFEYVEQEYARNKMAFYVGNRLDDYDFIGVMEYMDHEMEPMAEALRWPEIPSPPPHLNVGNYPCLMPNVERWIIDHNPYDLELYAEILSRKGLQLS